jgi:hypothetical protein
MKENREEAIVIVSKGGFTVVVVTAAAKTPLDKGSIFESLW